MATYWYEQTLMPTTSGFAGEKSAVFQLTFSDLVLPYMFFFSITSAKRCPRFQGSLDKVYDPGYSRHFDGRTKRLD